jgi:4a-hydroxytetrahydrobiopterin dehydratase
MERTLSQQEASDPVSDLGWRYLLGTLRTSVLVTSLAHAAEVTIVAVAAYAAQADRHLRADVRADRVVLTLQSPDRAALTECDTDLAHRVTVAVRGIGLRTEPDMGGGAPRSVQMLEIAIDALDIPTIRPCWKAVLGYAAEPGADGRTDPLVDPVGQGPAVWFQQMDQARPQRNPIHFDMCIPHDATRRIQSGLAAGGCSPTTRRRPSG